jgi:hypothetical protein
LEKKNPPISGELGPFFSMKAPLMCKLKAIFLKPKFDKICQKNEFPPLLLLGMKF